MKSASHMFFALILALASVSAVAQPGPGAGQQGKGPGFHFNQGNTTGWSMMSEQERADHRQKMMSMKSYDECVAYMNEHHKLMQERASQKGKSLPMPKYNACEKMKSNGMFR